MQTIYRSPVHFISLVAVQRPLPGLRGPGALRPADLQPAAVAARRQEEEKVKRCAVSQTCSLHIVRALFSASLSRGGEETTTIRGARVSFAVIFLSGAKSSRA